jgi:hypothetical protein
MVRNLNPNIEIRNPKQYQNPNVQNSKQSQGKAVVVLFRSFVLWSFRFASSFDLPAYAGARSVHSMRALLMPDLDHPGKQRLWQAGIRISDFRVSAKWVKCQPQDHGYTLPKSEAELLRHGTSVWSSYG